MTDPLALAMGDLEEQNVLEMVRERLAGGEDAHRILGAGRDGMAIVGQRYESGEYFISDLMMAGAIVQQVTDLLGPHLATAVGESGGKVVIGTVAGDIHDIGKDIVVSLLKAANYEVIDLGVDVPAGRFVETLRETGAPVLALSGLLTVAFDGMKATIAALEAAELRTCVKVMIGGGPVNEAVREYTGADAWGADATAAVRLCGEWHAAVPA